MLPALDVVCLTTDDLLNLYKKTSSRLRCRAPLSACQHGLCVSALTAVVSAAPTGAAALVTPYSSIDSMVTMAYHARPCTCLATHSQQAIDVHDVSRR